MAINYLALDVGEVRIGVALANDIARIASPLSAIQNNESITKEIAEMIESLQITDLVIGLPRGLDGQATAQTRYVEAFITQLGQVVSVPIHKQDEALTSVKAEAELMQRKKPFTKGDVDSLSAVYILEDYLDEGVHLEAA